MTNENLTNSVSLFNNEENKENDTIEADVEVKNVIVVNAPSDEVEGVLITPLADVVPGFTAAVEQGVTKQP